MKMIVRNMLTKYTAVVLSALIGTSAQTQISFHNLYQQGQNWSLENQDSVVPYFSDDTYDHQTIDRPEADYPTKIIGDAFAPVPLDDIRLRGIPPIIKCVEGYILVGGICQNEQVVSGTASCGKKTDLFENGLCINIEIIKASLQCPKGAQSDSKKCYEIETIAPHVTCPKGSVLMIDGISCEHKEKDMNRQNQECPADYSLKRGQCYKELRIPAVPFCGDKQVLQTDGKKDECFGTDIIPSEASCKERGFHTDGSRCVKIDATEPKSKCPSGFKSDDSGMCSAVEYISATYVCPEDTTPSSKGCVSRVYETGVLSCKKDFVFQNDVCRKHEKKPQILRCPEGYKKKDKSCVQPQSIDPERRCPPGTTYKEKGCIQNIETPATPHCENGDLDETGNCVEVEYAEAREICSSGKLYNKMCISTTINMADLVCPPGTQLEGKYCIDYRLEKPKSYCKKSGLTPGPDGCTQVERGELQLACKDGWKLQGDVCSKEVEGETLYLCPHGSILTGRKCEGHQIIHPDVVCPSKEYALGTGGVCVAEEERNPLLSCPHDFLLSGSVCIQINNHHSKTKRMLSSRDFFFNV